MANEGRRAAYLRWRKKEGKSLSEEQQTFLTEFEAKKSGADIDAIRKINELTKTQLKAMTKDELTTLARAAKLIEDEEQLSKDALLDKLKPTPAAVAG